MAVRRRVRGDRSVRKLLRKLPDAMRDELAGLMDEAGDELLGAMRADVPRRTGALAGGLSKRVLKASLRLQVGFIGRAVNRQLFYSRFVEFGRKAQTVTVRRLNRGARAVWTERIRAGRARLAAKPRDLVTTYQLRVRPMAGRPFVYTRRTALREAIGKRIAAFWDKAIGKAAAGVGDD